MDGAIEGSFAGAVCAAPPPPPPPPPTCTTHLPCPRCCAHTLLTASPSPLQVRIRGINDVAPKTKKILQLLRLLQINNGVFLRVRRAAWAGAGAGGVGICWHIGGREMP